MTTDQLFNQISTIIPTLDGWCTPDRAVKLARFIVETKPDFSACLGVWGGRDTLAMAMAHRFNNTGKCFAIDPFAASASVIGQEAEADRRWWGDQPMHDLVLSQFTQNKMIFGLDDWITFSRTTASEATPPEKIGVLVVDANHGPDSIADVEKWAPHVTPGGYVYMDDIHWTGGSVERAVERLLAIGFERLADQDTGAFFQRKVISLPAPAPETSKVSLRGKAEHNETARALAARIAARRKGHR